MSFMLETYCFFLRVLHIGEVDVCGGERHDAGVGHDSSQVGRRQQENYRIEDDHVHRTP